MKIADLSPEVIERIKQYRYDQLMEKHEGPWSWEGKFRFGQPEFLSIDSYDVLLPVHRDQHANITILRCIVSDDQQVLTIFLKDTTYTPNPEDEWWGAGRVAICEKFEDQAFYLAIFYHEWFVTEKP